MSRFISQLKKLCPEIMLPTDQKRHVLCSIVSTAVNETGKEWIQRPGYRNSRSLIFDSIHDFSDQEIASYNDHETAAASALRSVLDPVDRVNKRGRKDEIPENCKDRNWLIQALTKLETIKDPLLIKFKLSAMCRLFLRGKCARENCKYSHAATAPPQPSSQPKPAAAAASKSPSRLILPASGGQTGSSGQD